ncbi:MAG TPA: response regulator transcription factor [Myxococcota bacterium]
MPLRILVQLAAASPTSRAELAALLESAGHTVVNDGRADLMIVDDAAEVARARAADPALPILTITAGDDVLARVAALRAGADDAMAAPFHASQMMARVDALGRRASLVPKPADIVDVDGATLDLTALTCTRGHSESALTPREASLLRFLLVHRERAVSRSELLVAVWGHSAEMATRTVDMTIARLRKKIERDPQDPRVIVSVVGAGYRLGHPVTAK